MSEELKDPQGTPEGNTPEGGHPDAPAGGVDYEKRYKDLQSAFTKTTEEVKQLREAREHFERRDREWQDKWKEVESVKEKYQRLESAFAPAPQAEPAMTPEQAAELDRILGSSQSFREQQEQLRKLNQTIEAQQKEAEQSRALARQRSIDEAGYEVEQELGLVKTDDNGRVDDTGKKEFFDFLAKNPIYLYGMQQAQNKDAVKNVLRQAYYAQQYPNLQRNAVNEGVKIVEQKLNEAENTTQVERPTSRATTESKEIQFKPGDTLDDVWRQAVAIAEQD